MLKKLIFLLGITASTLQGTSGEVVGTCFFRPDCRGESVPAQVEGVLNGVKRLDPPCPFLQPNRFLLIGPGYYCQQDLVLVPKGGCGHVAGGGAIHCVKP